MAPARPGPVERCLAARPHGGWRGPGLRVAFASAALLAALAAAPAARAATHDVAVGDNFFQPADLTVASGDTVKWTFGGLSAHTVTSSSSAPEQFDSEQRTATDPPFEHTFMAPGTYNYFCELHFGMNGVVRVPGEGGGGGGASGDPAPTIGSLRASPFRARSVIRFLFDLSEPAELTGRVRRARRPKRTVRRFERQGVQGENSIRMSVRKLRPGPYDLFLTAQDGVGNRSATERKRFHVRRRAGSSRASRLSARVTARGRGPPARPRARTAASQSVTISDFEYAPRSVSIDVGDTVTWRNDGPSIHTATARNGSFDTGDLRRGESGSHTFNRAGTFRYYCRPHEFMRATVTVGGGGGSASGSGTGGSSSGSGGASGSSGPGAGSGGGSSSLAHTGFEAASFAALGALLLLLGVALRRRLGRAQG
jgi:plastocyanin